MFWKEEKKGWNDDNMNDNMCGDLGKATRSRQMSFHVKCSIVKLFLDVFDYLWKFLKIIKNQWIDLLKQFKKLCIKYSKESSKQQLTQFLFLATSHCFSQITTHIHTLTSKKSYFHIYLFIEWYSILGPCLSIVLFYLLQVPPRIEVTRKYIHLF